MAEFEDEKPRLTPLVIGLTRSPTLWGVPYMAVVVVIAATIIAWLATTSFWSFLAAPVFYLVLFALCAWDHRILEIAQVVLRCTPPTRNRAFWGTDSYGP
ncbi:type IV secretion system protein VirB3 [Nitratireductor sp. GCM10026969]|uniref:type IV secretion system protein VirB3 n=1 Tax=Nitratireductor sp. GCM10026969 TaxID=3252645 RepID=UPI0036067F85